MSAATRIPVLLLTGFLGSGKTTLLNHLLQQSGFHDTLVIINEFGSTSLDHLLVATSVESIDDIIVLPGGCVCCSMRNDLKRTLKDITWRFARAGQRQFSRVIIETTGLADPAPILHTLHADRELHSLYQLLGTITCVDGQLGAAQLHTQALARKQAAMADLFVISKVDLASPVQVKALQADLLASNPYAEVIHSVRGEVEAQTLLQLDWTRRPRTSYQPSWREVPAVATGPVAGIMSHHLVLPEQLYWAKLQPSLRALCEKHGEHLLRVKGIVFALDQDGPLAVQGVQHTLYQAAVLSEITPDMAFSQLIFIGMDLDVKAIASELIYI